MNAQPPVDVVTGAFGFTGSRIAERLLAAGHGVRTISRRPAGAHPLAGRVDVQPYGLERPSELRDQLDGAGTLYITYWIRFPRDGVTFEPVVENVRRLVAAAAGAGLRRVIYISVSNAAHDASTAYFRAKAQAEDAVRAAGISYAIIRPTLLYGEGDILINNMAWTLRRLPLFGIPGDGTYRVQPVYVDDVADLAIELGLGLDDGAAEVDAAGVEVFSFNDLVELVARAVGSRSRLIHLPPSVVLASTRLMGLAVRDVVLTRDEITELMESLLVSRFDATRPTRFSEWLETRGETLGRRYASELARNFRLSPG
ncbi:MAG: NAD(P)H-binding protein [Chloroflexota bacterium]|nr:NAD(P)H-binding protein [Chloroflexota bacterium]